jgi:Holliday junction resolvase
MKCEICSYPDGMHSISCTENSESQIQTYIKEYLAKSGWYVFKIHQQGKYCFKGITDLIAIKNGLTIYVEVKAWKGKLSDDQIKFRDNIVSKGGKHLVARNLDNVIEFIKAV